MKKSGLTGRTFVISPIKTVGLFHNKQQAFFLLWGKLGKIQFPQILCPFKLPAEPLEIFLAAGRFCVLYSGEISPIFSGMVKIFILVPDGVIFHKKIPDGIVNLVGVVSLLAGEKRAAGITGIVGAGSFRCRGVFYGIRGGFRGLGCVMQIPAILY